MSQPTNPNSDFPPPSGARLHAPHRETLLLTDVPATSSAIAEQVAPPVATSQLSTNVLAALSQRYDILAEAGHGSMGNVYKARDRETGEIVALKLLKPEIASDLSMMERFKNELLFARKITHKNVCRLHEFNRINGIAYTSMEFVEGESLRSVLNRFGGLPTRKAIDLVGQICSGLKEAHVQGIVHRDLKPENVMIDAQGNVKIMDFGIARSMEALTRLTGSMVGTPAYMAPEQAAGKPVDYRTDVYSLGLIMYEIFTGAPAFQADSAVAVALKQMQETPKPPHEIEPAIPVSIERSILKCLEKDPAKRFQTIAELENSLRVTGAPSSAPVHVAAATNHSNISASLSQPFYSPPAPASRRPSPAVWLVAALFVVGAAIAGWHWMQVAQMAENIPPPAPLAAPTPPDFALDVPVVQPTDAGPLAAKPDATKPVESTDRTPPPAKPEPANAAPPRESTPSGSASDFASQHPVARDVRRRAEKAFGEARQSPASPPAGSIAADGAQSYLWVGRFERQDPAQNAASKIEGLGLPVTVVPRHNEKGEFFVVVTGPFGAEKIQSVVELLDMQGFHNVRQVPSFMSSPRQNQNP